MYLGWKFGWDLATLPASFLLKSLRSTWKEKPFAYRDHTQVGAVLSAFLKTYISINTKTVKMEFSPPWKAQTERQKTMVSKLSVYPWTGPWCVVAFEMHQKKKKKSVFVKNPPMFPGCSSQIGRNDPVTSVPFLLSAHQPDIPPGLCYSFGNSLIWVATRLHWVGWFSNQ